MLKLTTNKVNVLSLVLTAFALILVLSGCSEPQPRTVVQGHCPAGLYEEWDSGECEEWEDAMDLDEDDEYEFKKKKAKTKQVAKPASKGVVSSAKPKAKAPKAKVAKKAKKAKKSKPRKVKKSKPRKSGKRR